MENQENFNLKLIMRWVSGEFGTKRIRDQVVNSGPNIFGPGEFGTIHLVNSGPNFVLVINT